METHSMTDADSRQPLPVPEAQRATLAARFHRANDVEFLKLGYSPLPLFISARPGKFASLPEFLEWIGANRKTLDDAILEVGGIVLRGFPLRTAEDFNQFTNQFPAYGGGYVGGSAPRKTIVGNVMEATQLGPDVQINIHQEMAYLKTYPPRICFFCRLPAAVGGETTIASMRKVTQNLPAWLRPLMEEHGVRGVSNFAASAKSDDAPIEDNYDEKPWEVSYGSNSREEVEAMCKEMGQQAIWNKDGSLTVVTKMDAFTPHPRTGERFYRNRLHTAHLGYEYLPRGAERRKSMIAAGKLPTGYSLGNGQELSREQSRELEKVIANACIMWDWQAGDVMILDNLQVAHGRERYKGAREVMVALFDQPGA